MQRLTKTLKRPETKQSVYQRPQKREPVRYVWSCGGAVCGAVVELWWSCDGAVVDVIMECYFKVSKVDNVSVSRDHNVSN